MTQAPDSPDTLAAAFGGLFLRLHRLMDRRMAREGASVARTKLLLFISRQGPVRGTDVAEFFALAPRTVTEALDRLERDGLLRRETDPEDRRVKRISITEEGRRAVAAAEPLRLSLVEQTFGGLDADERAALGRILAKLGGLVGDSEGSDSLSPPPAS